MISIEAKLCQDIDNDQDAACQADGQACDVNEGIAFVSFYPAEGYFYVVPEELGHEARRLPGRPAAKTARVSFIELFADVIGFADFCCRLLKSLFSTASDAD